MKATNTPLHPGPHVKEHVLPKGLSVTKAAELMGVGRPALSNFLNGKAALSAEMAARLEKAFGVDKADLLRMQQEYEAVKNREQESRLAVRTYVTPYLTITARSIDAWAEKNIEAQSLLAALLRRLVHTTGLEVTKSDFPAHDNSQRHGWDGYVESSNASAWVPQGSSGWEFGCNEKPTSKANSDYKARTAGIPQAEREQTIFVFVTPRNWSGKSKWLEEKRAEKKWLDVRAYDANDLEQWLEQSVPAQVWFTSTLGLSTDGCQTLSDYWDYWANTTEPPLSPKIFDEAATTHQGVLANWLDSSTPEVLVIAADSKEEAQAFVSAAALHAEELGSLAEQGVFVSTAEAAMRLGAISSHFIPIATTDKAEVELAHSLRGRRAMIIAERRVTRGEPQITIDLPSYESFSAALSEMGLEHEEISRLANHSGMSPTILRRLLAKLPVLKKPRWATQAHTTDMVPLVFAGAWESSNENDQEILKVLAETDDYPRLEKQIALLASLDDAPIWSEGRFRGVVSKLECFHAVADQITLDDLERFFFVAEYVLCENDPSLDLEKDKHWCANLYNKVRNHSAAIRQSIGETLTILAVHGDGLNRRLETSVSTEVAGLVGKLLVENETGRVWQSQQGDLPRYAEAAPDMFLDIVEKELQKDTPAFRPLFEPVESGMFSRCDRTGMLWALELLAWAPERLGRVIAILGQLSRYPLEDNRMDKPIVSLKNILLSWRPHTSATFDQRVEALETLCKNFPDIGWQVCISELRPGASESTFGTYRPRWRNDASGVKSFEGDVYKKFRRKCLEIILAWATPTKDILIGLIECMSVVPKEERDLVYQQFEKWLASSPSDEEIIEVRERVRTSTFTHRAQRFQKDNESGRADGRKIYDLLEPADIVLKHQWLFAKNWVEYSPEELEDEELDHEEREQRLSGQRVRALNEIFHSSGPDGILRLCRMGDGGSMIGWHLGRNVLSEQDAIDFALETLLTQPYERNGPVEKCLNELLAQFGEERCGDVLDALMDRLKDSNHADEQKRRVVLAAPFARQVWENLAEWGKGLNKAYWSSITPSRNRFEERDLNFVVDQLMKVDRPRAAFYVVHLEPQNVESRRLVKLLHDLAVSPADKDNHFPTAKYAIEAALEALNQSGEVSRPKMAELEYLYIRALTSSEYGIPNLSQEIAESPQLFMRMLAICFKRHDDGIDPPEWHVPTDPEVWPNAGMAAVEVLEYANVIPGARGDGTINTDELDKWVVEARRLASENGRAEIGDQRIGHLLSHCGPDDDDLWPRAEIRQVFEEVASKEMSIGMENAVINSEGFHCREADGAWEHKKAATYREYADRLSNTMTFTARMLRNLAKSYEHNAEWWAREVSIRRRLRC